MQLYRLKHNVEVFCVDALSFPKGIKAAFDQLNIIAALGERNIFGISKPQSGVIRYRAAASVNFEGEFLQLGYPRFTIPKGFYLGETLMDWQKNEMMIMGIFNRLVADKRMDGSAHCIEWYKSPDELVCIVLMRGEKITGNIEELAL